MDYWGSGLPLGLCPFSSGARKQDENRKVFNLAVSIERMGIEIACSFLSLIVRIATERNKKQQMIMVRNTFSTKNNTLSWIIA
ncbi:MAG: hypothetical protein ACKODM_03235 [Cytophagales bacterium]